MTYRRKRRRFTAPGILPWLSRQFGKRPRPLWLLWICHVLALGIALLLYALPHHVIPHGEAAEGVVSRRPGTVQAVGAIQGDESGEAGEAEKQAQPVETEAPVPVDPTPEAPAESPEPVAQAVAGPAEEAEAAQEESVDAAAVGNFRERFADKFTSGKVKRTPTSYRSANVAVTLNSQFLDELGAWVYITDIYVADISCLRTAFAQDTYGRGYTEWITNVATRYKSLITMNGDYYGCRSTGVIIRNGELYRKKKYKGDICVLYWDGHMETFKGSKMNAMDEVNRGAYQSWSFGPSLLDASGQPLKKYNCDERTGRRNPRSAIGYFEPGHYCFVVIDGRNEESRGSNLTNLATILSRLGCKVGYNLDGGQTSLLAAGDELINHPCEGGRSSSDYIMVVDYVTQ